VSFFGGGTDHPDWYNNFGPGAVLSTTINKYVYITLRNLPAVFDYNYRIAWRIIEQARTINEIQHPVVREVLRNYGRASDPGFEISYNADLPARSGLGSSSAFTVAALHALFRHQGRPVSKSILTNEAIRVEQEFLQEPVGSQDQTAVAYGGLNRIDFSGKNGIDVCRVDVSVSRRHELQSHLMMFFTGFTRDAGSVEKKKIENFESRRGQMERMYRMVDAGEEMLLKESVPIESFGSLLHQAWVEKRSLAAGVSNGPIDEIYKAGLEAGAVGGKLLGAGGGGFLLFFVPPERQKAVAQALSSMRVEGVPSPVHVPFQLESEGSSVVLFQPELTSNYEPALTERPFAHATFVAAGSAPRARKRSPTAPGAG
jgi:D-glycero-alpha-D-manno-heptose-7-phosphate kinase